MKSKKFLATIIFAAGLIFSGNCFAEVAGDNLLNDFKQKRADYINCGMENISYSVDKNSLNVLKYAPPEYIISVNLIYYSSNGLKGNTLKEFAKSMSRQYRYDYAERRMYVKRSDDSGAAYWIFVDPKMADKLEGYKNDWDMDMAAGEIAFYLAYGMSFFEKPVSEAAKQVIMSR